MSKKGGVPDAWDDDWENLADKPDSAPSQPEPPPKLSKAQRRAQHLEQQKQLWDSAENPDRFHWLEAQGVVPLKQEFKPQVKVLSRKPVAPVIAKKETPADGVANLTLNDNDDEDSEEEARRKRETDAEERARKAKIEREEKQRKYAEARERIMGSPSPSVPASASRESSHGRDNRRSKGKINSNRNSQPTSANQSPARQAPEDKQLFDPDDMSRRAPKREMTSTPKEDEPMRQPRGPEKTGRGGFGFAARGGKVAS